MLTTKQQAAYEGYITKETSLTKLGALLCVLEEGNQVHLVVTGLAQKADLLQQAIDTRDEVASLPEGKVDDAPVIYAEKVLANARKNAQWKIKTAISSAALIDGQHYFTVAARMMEACVGTGTIEDARNAVIYRALDERDKDGLSLSDEDTDTVIGLIDTCLA